MRALLNAVVPTINCVLLAVNDGVCEGVLNNVVTVEVCKHNRFPIAENDGVVIHIRGEITRASEQHAILPSVAIATFQS